MQGDMNMTDSLASGFPMIRVAMKSENKSGIAVSIRLTALKNMRQTRLVRYILSYLPCAPLSDTICAIAGGRLAAQRA